MPKKFIKEGILDKIITSLFKLVATGKERKAINTALGKDPQFKKDIKTMADINKRIRKRLDTDPRFKKAWDNFTK